jgi:hypothetical protein
LGDLADRPLCEGAAARHVADGAGEGATRIRETRLPTVPRSLIEGSYGPIGGPQSAVPVGVGGSPAVAGGAG